MPECGKAELECRRDDQKSECGTAELDHLPECGKQAETVECGRGHQLSDCGIADQDIDDQVPECGKAEQDQMPECGMDEKLSGGSKAEPQHGPAECSNEESLRLSKSKNQFNQKISEKISTPPQKI